MPEQEKYRPNGKRRQNNIVARMNELSSGLLQLTADVPRLGGPIGDQCATGSAPRKAIPPDGLSTRAEVSARL
jgi:hypothetical protein